LANFKSAYEFYLLNEVSDENLDLYDDLKFVKLFQLKQTGNENTENNTEGNDGLQNNKGLDGDLQGTLETPLTEDVPGSDRDETVGTGTEGEGRVTVGELGTEGTGSDENDESESTVSGDVGLGSNEGTVHTPDTGERSGSIPESEQRAGGRNGGDEIGDDDTGGEGNVQNISESGRELSNYAIKSDDLVTGEKFSPGQRAEANIRAIELLRELEKSQLTPTAKEKDILVSYVGWGGMPEIFDERKPNKTWDNLRNKLQNLLTEEEYKSARASTLNAHYTTPGVIRGMYRILKTLMRKNIGNKYGYRAFLWIYAGKHFKYLNTYLYGVVSMYSNCAI